MHEYDAANWFWIVEDGSRYWSSAAAFYVESLPAGAVATSIFSEEELRDVLSAYRLAGPLITSDDVISERDRRLSLGFEYDFGNERGVHHIATTPEDMKGWDEVSKLPLPRPSARAYRIPRSPS